MGSLDEYLISHWKYRKRRVPAETRSASTYILAVDNTSGHFNGVALANVSSSQAQVTVTVRDPATGPVLGMHNFVLGPHAHTA